MFFYALCVSLFRRMHCVQDTIKLSLSLKCIRELSTRNCWYSPRVRRHQHGPLRRPPEDGKYNLLMFISYLNVNSMKTMAQGTEISYMIVLLQEKYIAQEISRNLKKTIFDQGSEKRKQFIIIDTVDPLINIVKRFRQRKVV